MASGGMTPAPAAIPVQPMVSTKKNVPMNSVAYFLMAVVVKPIPRVKWRCGVRCSRAGSSPSSLQQRRPIDDERDRRRGVFGQRVDEEALAVGGDIVKGAQPGPGSNLEERASVANLERGAPSVDGRRHQPVAGHIEDLGP